MVERKSLPRMTTPVAAVAVATTTMMVMMKVARWRLDSASLACSLAHDATYVRLVIK